MIVLHRGETLTLRQADRAKVCDRMRLSADGRVMLDLDAAGATVCFVVVEDGGPRKTILGPAGQDRFLRGWLEQVAVAGVDERLVRP